MHKNAVKTKITKKAWRIILMNSIWSAKIIWTGVLLLMLIVFSVLGFRALKPDSTQKDIDSFWISIILFLIVLTVYIGLFFSPILAIAPLFPIYIFTRLFLTTRKRQKNKN